MRTKAFLMTTAPLTAAMLFATPAIGQTDRERQQQQQQRQVQPGQQQQQRDMQQQQQQAVYMLAGTAKGKDVVNRAGEDLGDVSDLIVDVRNGSTPYAVVSFGGFLGMGRDSVAVPLAAFRWDPSEEEFILDTTRERLERAPDFDQDNWDNLHDDRWRTQIREAFGVVPGQHRDGQQRDMRQQDRSPQDMRRDQDRREQDMRRDQQGRQPQDRQTQQDRRLGDQETGEFKPYLMMSDLRGARVVGADGDRIGRIGDVILDQSSGHIGFVTIETGGVLGMGTTSRPVPWEALQRSGETEFRLSVTQDRISQSPELRTDDLNRLNNQQFRQSIYTFYQVQAREQPRWDRDGQQQRDQQWRDPQQQQRDDQRQRDRDRDPR